MNPDCDRQRRIFFLVFTPVRAYLISYNLIRPVGKIKIEKQTKTNKQTKKTKKTKVTRLIHIGCIGRYGAPSFRLTSLNVMTSLNVTVLSSQCGERLQSKCLHYPLSEMKGVQEKESIMGMRDKQKYPSLGITVWHHSASPVLPDSNSLDGFFYLLLTIMTYSYNLPLTTMIDSFSCTPFISEPRFFNSAVTSIADVRHIVKNYCGI